MPLRPLVTVGVENLLNTFLYRLPILKSARACLQGKVLCVGLKGSSTPLVLIFSEYQAGVLGAQGGGADCTVITYAGMLPRLRDRQQLAALICSDELKVQGDIQVVQNFVTLVDLTELDPAELLASYTGDAVAEGVNRVSRGEAKPLCYSFQCQQRYVAEAVIEEWRMVPGPLEVVWFAEETAVVERAVESLVRRPEKLEVK